MSRTSRLQSVHYEAETTYAEEVYTFGTRLGVYDVVDVSGLTKTKQESPRATQYRGEKGIPIPLVKGGSFKIRLPMAGHGSSTAGAGLAVTAVETLLGHVFGVAELSAAGGTTVTSATDADTFAVAASGTFDSKGFAFLGAKGDGRGDGQPVAIDSHSTNTIQLLTAAPAAPTNGDVFAAATQIYADESPDATFTSLRFRISSANQCYDCIGCVPTAVEYETAIGRPLTITITFDVAWWKESTPTFPSTDSFEEPVPAPFAGGSLFFQVYGTATRATYTIRELSLSHAFGVALQDSPLGSRGDQVRTGAVRAPETFQASFVLDAQTQSASPTWPANWDAEQDYHVLIGFSGAASGKRVGLYLRRFRLDQSRPVQMDMNGVNSIRINGTATTDVTGADDRARASYVWIYG